MNPTGLLVMAYGTPATPADVESYYTHIRRGRPPSDDQLHDLQGRYEAIGGISPLGARTEAQRHALETALGQKTTDPFLVRLGQKHAAPFIEDAVADLAAYGVQRVVALVLAPHYSDASVGEYLRRAGAAAQEHGIEVRGIESWHTLEPYVAFLAEGVRTARQQLPARHKVLFTAHSLPERVLVDDPYEDQLRESAALVADAVGLAPWTDWSLAWQSAGRTGEAWRGPDVCEVVVELGATGRSDGVLVCAQGFTSDHLEVLYDLDIAARAKAGEAGVAFARTASLNDDPAVMGALAALVVERADP